MYFQEQIELLNWFNLSLFRIDRFLTEKRKLDDDRSIEEVFFFILLLTKQSETDNNIYMPLRNHCEIDDGKIFFLNFNYTITKKITTKLLVCHNHEVNIKKSINTIHQYKLLIP